MNNFVEESRMNDWTWQFFFIIISWKSKIRINSCYNLIISLYGCLYSRECFRINGIVWIFIYNVKYFLTCKYSLTNFKLIFWTNFSDFAGSWFRKIFFTRVRISRLLGKINLKNEQQWMNCTKAKSRNPFRVVTIRLMKLKH